MPNKPKYTITKFQWFTPIAVLIFYVYMFVESWNLKAFSNDIIASDFMPKVVTALGFFIAVYIIIEQAIVTIREKKAFDAINKDGKNDANAVAKEKMTIEGFITKNISVITLLLIAVYISMMKPIGFILASIFYLFVQIMLIAPKGKKKPIQTAILAVVFSVAIYLIFVKGFYVMLPPGIFSL